MYELISHARMTMTARGKVVGRAAGARGGNDVGGGALVGNPVGNRAMGRTKQPTGFPSEFPTHGGEFSGPGGGGTLYYSRRHVNFICLSVSDRTDVRASGTA